MQINTEIEVLDSIDDLSTDEQELLIKAREIAKTAYAPYSQFQVGAAVLLENGVVVLGSNQENVAFPSGMCAERVAVFAAGANYPDQKIKTIAITACSNSNPVEEPVPPCGACRQAIFEYENKWGDDIRIIMSGESGEVWIADSMNSLLPLVFTRDDLRKS